MKRKFFYAVFLVLMSSNFSSCEKDRCKQCYINYYNGLTETYAWRSGAGILCGSELREFEGQPDKYPADWTGLIWRYECE